MDNKEIARRFYRLSALMEVRGDDPFRLRSYRNAAEAIEVWPTSLKEIADKEGVTGLQEIPGVGKAIAGKVVELLIKGTFDAWERLTKETPETVLDLLEIPGIGPKTAALLHQRFKVSSLPDLKTFVASGGLDLVDGIGPKTAEKIKRRDFIRNSAAAGIAFPMILTQSAVKPLVISSANGNRFKNGGSMTAVQKAFTMMTGGADVLDAVIAGVNIVELDPLDDSVGYGGLPNADGVVQLDS